MLISCKEKRELRPHIISSLSSRSDFRIPLSLKQNGEYAKSRRGTFTVDWPDPEILVGGSSIPVDAQNR